VAVPHLTNCGPSTSMTLMHRSFPETYAHTCIHTYMQGCNRKVVGSIPGWGMSGGGRWQPCVKGILSGDIAALSRGRGGRLAGVSTPRRDCPHSTHTTPGGNTAMTG